MAKKIGRRLVALSASAVATIYVAGLLSTQPAAESAAAAAGAGAGEVVPPSASLASTAADSAGAPIVVVGASAPATRAPTSTSISTSTSTPTATSTGTAPAPAAPTSAVTASTYTDGTYAATGTSRFGNVSVSVTIANDKITNVQITRVTTSFPVSRIASLPAQVIQKQTANVNVVTGATYSSQAFRQAVQQALAQALAAHSTAAAG